LDAIIGETREMLIVPRTVTVQTGGDVYIPHFSSREYIALEIDLAISHLRDYSFKDTGFENQQKRIIGRG